jgi:hypothetical protein
MRSTLKMTAFATLVPVLLATGCSEERVIKPGPMAPENSPNASNPVDPDRPHPSMPAPPAPEQAPPAPTPSYSGIYDTSTPIDLSKNGVLPPAIGASLKGLSELHDKPGSALLYILENSNIPYISDGMKQIPDIVVSALGGLLDGLIKNNLYKGYPVVDEVANVIQGITQLATQIQVYDRITVHTPDTTGAINVDHQLMAVEFEMLGQKAKVPFPTAANGTAHTKGTLKAGPSAPVADADITADAATFSLPLGNLLLQAAGPLLFTKFGSATDLGGVLKEVVPCQSFGDSLSNATNNFLDPSLGTGLCNAALDVVASLVTSEINKITLDNVKVDGITAKLYDISTAKPNLDYQSDRLAEGKWNWTFTIGSASATVPTTFAGDRTGDAI